MYELSRVQVTMNILLFTLFYIVNFNRRVLHFLVAKISVFLKSDRLLNQKNYQFTVY